MDWLVVVSRKPTRDESHINEVKYRQVSLGAIIALIRFAATTVPIAVSAARHRPTTSR